MTEADWIEKRRLGFVRYLLVDGVLKMGAPFAVVMQILGFFLLRDWSQPMGDYFATTTIWVTFFFHATLFGAVMAAINWRRNEKAFSTANK